MSRKWLYLHEGAQKGPVTEPELRDLLRIDATSSGVLVWTEGMTSWESAAVALPRYALDIESAPAEGVEYFPVSTLKFVVMCVSTAGIYQLFWFYKNWKYLKPHYPAKISPFWRTVFSPLYCYGLFDRIKKDVSGRLPVDYSPGWLAAAYILFNLSLRLPDPLSYIGLLSFLPFLPVVWTINDANRSRVPHELMNARFSGWNIAMVAVFVALQLSNVVYWIRPELFGS